MAALSLIHQRRKCNKEDKNNSKLEIEQSSLEQEKNPPLKDTELQSLKLDLMLDKYIKEELEDNLSKSIRKLNRLSIYMHAITMYLLISTITGVIVSIFTNGIESLMPGFIVLFIMISGSVLTLDNKEINNKQLWVPESGKKIFFYLQKKLFSNQLLKIKTLQESIDLDQSKIRKKTLSYVSQFIQKVNKENIIEHNGKKYFQMDKKEDLLKLSLIEKEVNDLVLIDPALNRELFDEKMVSLTSKILT